MDSMGLWGRLKKAFQADLFGLTKEKPEQLSFAPKDKARIGEIKQFGPNDWRMLLMAPSGVPRWMDKKEVEETTKFHTGIKEGHEKTADELRGKAITPLIPYAKYHQQDIEREDTIHDPKNLRIGDLYFTKENPPPPDLKKKHDEYMQEREEHITAAKDTEQKIRELNTARDILDKKGQAEPKKPIFQIKPQEKFDPTGEAKRLGIQYAGPQKEEGETKLHVFQDPVSKGSFTVEPGGNVEEALKKRRVELEEGQKSRTGEEEAKDLSLLTPEEKKKLGSFTFFKKRVKPNSEEEKTRVNPKPELDFSGLKAQKSAEEAQTKVQNKGSFAISPKIGGHKEIFQMPKAEYLKDKKATSVGQIDLERLGQETGMEFGKRFESKTNGMGQTLLNPRESNFTPDEENKLKEKLSDQGYSVHRDHTPNTLTHETIEDGKGFRIEPGDLHELVHRNAVKNAKARGENVPEEVMKDYPEFGTGNVEQVGKTNGESKSEKPKDGEMFDTRKPKHIEILRKVNEAMPEGSEILPHPDTKLPFDSDKDTLQSHLEALGYNFGGILLHNEGSAEKPTEYEFPKKKKGMTWTAKMKTEPSNDQMLFD